MPPKLPPKKDVAIALLQGPSVFVHLDPRKDGVSVPQWFKKQFQLVLQVGMNMAVPIPDLDVGDEGISCTLSFNRSPFWCFMPWSAVYMLVGEDGRGMIWPEDVPPELTIAQNKPKLQVVDNKKPAKKPKLAAVVDAADAETDDVPAEAPEGDAGKPRPRLAAVPDEAPADDHAPEGQTAASDVEEAPAETEQAAEPASEAEDGGTASEDEGEDGDGTDGDGKDGDGGRKLPSYLRVIK